MVRICVDAVFARGVKVELSKLVRAAGGDEGTVGQDNLETNDEYYPMEAHFVFESDGTYMNTRRNTYQS
jgi:hypothetical protein